MDREEKLKMMKGNGAKNKEYERSALLMGDNMAACFGGLVGILFILIKLFVKKELDISLCFMVFLVASIQTIHEGFKLQKTGAKIIGILEGIAAFGFGIGILVGVFA